MNYPPNIWNNGSHRHTHWTPISTQGNPFQHLDAPMIAAAAHEVHINHDIDPLMALLMVFDAVSLTCAGLVDVVIPGHKAGPTVLFTLKVAGPSNGKSVSHDAIFRPIYDLQAEYIAEHESELEQYRKDYVVWSTKISALKQVMGKRIKKGEDHSLEEDSLRDHLERMPKSPGRGHFIFEDTTASAFHFGVYQNGISVMLGGAEGGTILLGDALDEPQKLNAFFSRENVRIDRKVGGSFTISGVSVGVGIATQPDVLITFQNSARGKRAAATGFNARLIVCDATNYQRSGFTTLSAKTWEACEALHARLIEYMKKTLMTAHIEGFSREDLRFSVDAAARWGEIRGQIESARMKGGLYEFAQDHAGRLPEIIARIAALIHFFERKPGDIDLGSLESANYIVSRASQDYLRLFVPPPKEYVDAQILDAHWEVFRKRGIFQFDKSYARSSSPSSVRKSGYDLAVLVLLEQGKVCYAQDAHGYPCLQIVPINTYGIQQIAFGRLINGTRYLP